MRLLREQLLLMELHNCLKNLPIDAMVHLISSGLNELALWLALQRNHEQAMKDYERVIAIYLEAIKK